MNNPHDKNTEDLAHRVLGRIDHERLAPRPRWKFLLKNYVFWGLGVLAVVFGALAFSATLFELQNVDWALSPATHPSIFAFFIETAPFFWVVALALFTLVGYLYVRRTAHGYRYPLIAILSAAGMLALLFGTGLYAIGFGGTVEEGLGDHPGFYRPILAQERSWWAAPEKGLLAGEVSTTAPSTAGSFVLHDFSGEKWIIDTSDLRALDFAVVSRGGPVRVVGAPATSSAGLFHACFVFPWGIKGPRPGVLMLPGGMGSPDRSDMCKAIRPYKQLRVIEQSEDSGEDSGN